MFDINPDLGDVDNVHVGEQVVHCSSDVFIWEAPWTASLPGGQIVYGSGTTWPVASNSTPALLKAFDVGTSGQGALVIDNEEDISLPPPPPPRIRVRGGVACAAGSHGERAGWGALGLIGMLALSRTMRRRRA